MNRKALGKGINALIPDFEMGVPESGEKEMTQSRELLIDEISPNRFQPRKYFDDDKLEELVTSIRENGVLQPVVVQKAETGYELVVGERRWRASKKAGLKKIPAMIREVSDAQALELAIIENIHRQDLNPIEEAEAYARLADEFALTQEMIAKKVGKSRATVANILRLLKLSRSIKADLISGKLSMGHARALLGLDNPGQMQALCREIFKQDLTVRQTENQVNRLKQPAPTKLTPSAPKKDIFIRDMEKELERKLGTKVEISPKKTGGKLVVTYYSDDDLERIQNLIGQR
ncbi:MAG: ParB/RepB/Spo0J family partition protein [Nitrospinae bacterium]|nr:ParB/RepB/Spo0J family partition protein [Nitrospinota bacterium]MBL7021376.1 ParB/RepB/Spo0J family partition protein [Nitrospinaceae bacterium]